MLKKTLIAAAALTVMVLGATSPAAPLQGPLQFLLVRRLAVLRLSSGLLLRASPDHHQGVERLRRLLFQESLARRQGLLLADPAARGLLLTLGR